MLQSLFQGYSAQTAERLSWQQPNTLHFSAVWTSCALLPLQQPQLHHAQALAHSIWQLHAAACRLDCTPSPLVSPGDPLDGWCPQRSMTSTPGLLVRVSLSSHSWSPAPLLPRVCLHIPSSTLCHMFVSFTFDCPVTGSLALERILELQFSCESLDDLVVV